MIYPTLQRILFQRTQPSILVSMFQSYFLPRLLHSKWCLYKKKNDRRSLMTSSGIFWISTDGRWQRDSSMFLLWVCGAPVATSQPVAQWLWKLNGYNMVNKPDDMMNKPDLVHFKTELAIFPLYGKLDFLIFWWPSWFAGFGFSDRGGG